MGWKKIKDCYQIGHFVQVTEKGICIGTSYVHDLCVINVMTGAIRENETFKGFVSKNYPALLDAAPDELLKLINTPDSFTQSLVVYTYIGAQIIEKQCEEYGWPNVTHDGQMMYENIFFKQRGDAIEKAIENAQYSIEHHKERLGTLEEDLKIVRKRLEESSNNLNKLQAMRVNPL